MARSGLQIEIRSLYRECMRAVNRKPAETQPRWYAFVRRQFDEHMSIRKKDFATLECNIMFAWAKRSLKCTTNPASRIFIYEDKSFADCCGMH
ncbi:hypothetical protein BCR37DRAFT_375465 [Protomyces lactucae-debilis]|uniref:Complex 1 LYR protein domain-containing protein n=1 Tax=Protomyces lactucae-debilis TaxID=2754530 RepID=A0A1Y2FY58_PROLT|nr:uncharacterized protein BCR37DRAFT_375465 [Protomyces lactucae-debilis]ORY87605.1 hypothetical protein BCR37DRAFT_375465 [Protomyces lactucae-debilis]